MNRVLLLVLIFFSTLACQNEGTELTIPEADINIDLAASSKPIESMVGFLHAMDASNPHDSLIVPLNPRYWRAGTLLNSIKSRIQQFGPTPIVTIGDLYSYPGDNVPGWKQPFEDSLGWKTLCANVFNQVKSSC